MKIFATKTNYIKTAVAFLALLFCLIMKSEVGWGQTVVMSNTTQNSVCSGTYYDPGGTGNYSNNQDFTQTFYPSAGNVMSFNFTSFNTESGFDYLYVYNGNSTAAPLIDAYNGNGDLSGIIYSTASDGSLTFKFHSDGATTKLGWVASISCVSPFINISNTTQTTCSSTYYDPGGTGNYSNNQDFTQTIYPATANNKIQISFSSFNTEDAGHQYDYLQIYNGNSAIAANLIGKYSGTSIPPTATSTAADGSLTFRFYSDAGTTDPGWVANISCITTASITTGTLTGSPFCVTAGAGAAVTVPFTSAGTFTGNTYTAQLSNAAGSFAVPVNIGTLVSNANSGNISATIPAGTATGTGYKIRVISSNPSVTGSSSAAFSINLAANAIAPSTTQNIGVGINGATLTVTEQSIPTSRAWYYGTTSGGPYSTITGVTGTSYTPNFATQGTYYVVCLSTFPCGVITSNQVQIIVTPTITAGAISGSPFCVTASAGAPVTVPFTSVGTFSGNTYTAQLSNATGSFAAPTNIGTLVSDANSGTISATIPTGTATGTGYRIRVVSNGPSVTGSDNGTNLIINLAANSITPVATQNIVTGANGNILTVAEQSTPSSRTWFYSTASGGPYTTSLGVTSTTYTPNFATPGTYYVVCISNFACATITSNQVQVNVAPTYKSQFISMFTGSATWCAGETRTISVTVKNIGTGTWVSTGPNPFNIGVKWNTNGVNWADYYVRTSAADLVPGATGTYNFTITASNNAGAGYTTPLANGPNNLIFDVVEEGISWFGDNGGNTGPGNVKFTSPTQTITTSTNSIAPAGIQNINVGANGPTLTVTESTPAISRTWFYGTASGGPYNTSTGISTTTYQPNFATQGTYYVVCVSNLLCGTITSNAVQVNVAASVTTGTISGSPFCITAGAGSAVMVPFTSAGTFTANTYTAQLSSATGVFPGTNIGTLVSNANSGTISATIPAGTATGTGYRIRVISNSPAITGSTNTTNLTINLAANSIAPIAPQNINAGVNGTALTVTEQSVPTSRMWFYGTTNGGPYSTSLGVTTTSYTPNFAAQGTYYVVCISTYPCGVITSNQVQIIVTATITTGTISGSPFCAGSSISVPFTSAGSFTGNTYTAQLSSATGSFVAPVNIGTLVSNGNSGTISATIPLATTTGTGYRIRVVSSSPVILGSNNGSDLSILASPTGSVTVTENSGIVNNDDIICAGDAVLFTAPSGNNSYTFKVNGTIVQGPNTDNTYSTTTFANGQTVTVDVANGNNCGTTFTAPTVTVTPLPVPILMVTENSGTPNDKIICPNAPVTLTATANAGSTYSFIVNGTTVSTGTSNSYVVNNIIANATVAVMETNSNSCQATTANQNITVSPVPSGTLTVSPGSSFCAGTNVTFTATAGASGTIYNFKVDGVTQQSTTSNTYTTNALTNGQVVTVEATNTNSCSTTFNSIPVTVFSLPAGTITTTENSGIANDYNICAGANVMFTTTSGYSHYTFYLRNTSTILQDGTSNTYNSATLISGDYVTVVVTNGNSCTSTFPVSATITVVPSPTGALSISPSNTICAGDNVIFTADGGFSNYTFQVNGSTVQNGNSNTYNSNSLADNDVVSVDVTNSNSCTSTFNTITMQVNPLPTGTLAIAENAGIANDGVICTGTSVTFTAPAGFANYNFLLNGASIQNSSTRAFTTTSLNNGDKVTVAITNSGGCIGLLNEYIITVNPLPVVAPITAAPSFDVCVGNAVTLSDATNTGGTFIWSSENTSIATVDPATGLVTGIAGGTATIDYTFTNTNGCSSTVTATVTVHALPDVEPITGNFNICTGFTSQLDDATNTGGTWIWSSSDQAVATVDASTGLVTGVTPGSATISYAFTDANGCTTIVTTDIVVADAPSVAPITTTAPSSFNVCIGSTIKLKDATPGGTWSSVDGAVATISTTGIVTGLTAGTTEIRYTITTTCSQTVYASQIVTVNAPPSATISYADSPFCTTAGPVSVTQTGTIGGTYSSAGGLSLNTADGTITPSASTPGTYTITYKVAASGGCGVYTTTTTVTITQAPSATIAYSGSPYCSTLSTATVTRTGTAGGAYSSTLGLSIDVTTGTITPSSSTPGTYTVTYIIAASGGCAQFSTTASVTITPAPSATIIYSGSPYCSNGGTATVTRTGTTGGTYTKTGGPGTLSLNSATGDIILGTSTPGTYAVTYSVAASGGCSLYTTTTSIVITPAPGAVAGTTVATCSNNPPVNITAGSSATNYSTVVWSSSGTGMFANANSLTTATYTPSAADILAGSVTLTLTANGNGNCGPATSTKTLTISAPPAAFVITPSNPPPICQGTVQSLTATANTTTAGSMTFSSTSNNIAIPDEGSIGNNILVSLPAGAIISNVSVTFKVTHGYDDDLIFNLKAPNGKVLNLVNRDGGGGDNFTNTVINSTVVNPINAGTAAFTAGPYSPDASNNVGGPTASNVTAFTSLYTVPNGTWTFEAADNVGCHGGALACFFGLGDYYTGTLNNWSITINYTIPNSPLAVAWSPLTDLYTDAGATTAYTGTNLSTVYVKPSTSGSKTYTAIATNVANCSTAQDVTFTVNPTPVVTITADYCAVAGKVQLSANSTPAATNYLWSTGQTGATILVDEAGDYTVTAITGATCPGTATINVANELVANGNFEAGNAGFTTAYTYSTSAPNCNAGTGGLYPENTYNVTNNPQSTHCNFWGNDHTTGSGKFMLVNGSGTSSKVWQETVNVLPNTPYYFSAWAMSLNNAGNYAKLQFSVNGVLVGTTATLAAHNQDNNPSSDNWTRFYGTWTSGATTTSAVITIVDQQTAPSGNDFGLDDVSFSTLSTFINLVSGAGTDAQTLCVNTPIQNIVYSAGSSGTAPTVTGLPPGVSATFNGVYETISGTPTAAGNYSYTITTTGSCQPATATGTITVQQQKITLSSGSSSPTICVNTGVNIGYTLSGTATGATATGLPSGVNLSAPIGGVVTITGTPTIAGSYPYTITTSGTCSPVTTSGTITVTSQTVALNNGDDDNQTVCINSPIANIRYNVGGTATGASVAGLPPGVNGNYSGGIFTITGAPTSAAGSPYTYTVTTSGTCNPVTISGTITVTPGSTLTLTSDPATNPQTVCKGAAIVPVTFAVNNGTGASVTGLPAGVTGGYSGGVFTISGNPTAAPGTYTYTITASGGCAVAAGTATGSITVQAQTISLFSGSISPSVCANILMPTPIVFTIGGTASGATVTGLPAGVTGSFDGVTSKFTIGGTPTAASGSYPYTVTTSGSCASVIATGTITISAAPIGGNIASIASICSGQNGTLTLTGSTGNIIRWEFSTDGGGTWTPTTPANTTISQSFAVTMPTQYRAVVGNNCSNVTSSIATIAIHNYWTGGTSKDWNVASNWSDGLSASGSCSMYTIPAGTTFSPQLVANTSVTDITIASGAHLELNDKMLTITGSYNGTGTLTGSQKSELTVTGNAGILHFTSNDYVNNKITNNYLKTLILNDSAKATIGDSLNIAAGISDSVAVGSGGNLNGNAKLILKSDSTGTARVGYSLGTISDTVTVERFIPPLRAWRFLTVPFSKSNQSVHDTWQEGVNNYGLGLSYMKNPHPGFGTEITGNNYSNLGYDYNTTYNPSYKVWDSSLNAWNTVEPPTISTGITDYPAYCIFVRGDRGIDLSQATGATPTPTVLRAKGVLNQKGLSYSATYKGVNGKTIFVGNPYASSINISNVLSRSTGINQGIFYLWDPKSPGTYNVGDYVTVNVAGNMMAPPFSRSYPDVASAKIIESGQALMLQLSSISASVNFKEDDKIITQNNVFGFAGKQQTQDEIETPAIYTNLMVPVGDSIYLADGVGTGFGSQFSSKVDAQDANKLWNFDENIALVRETNTLAIELRPAPVLTDTLFYRLYLRQKPYTLQVFTQNFESMPPMKAWLVDRYLNTKTEVNLGDTTLYNFTPNPDTLSYRNRFMLVFNRQFAGGAVPVTKVINQENPNITGIANSITAIEPGVSVYPNPASTKKVTLQFSGMDKGYYEITVYSPKGQKLASREINYPGGNTSFPLLLNPSWNAGVYNVEIISKDSKKTVNLKLVISR